MKLLSTTLWLSLAYSAQSTQHLRQTATTTTEQEQENNNNNRQAVETRIVGGNQAEKDEYPFMGKCLCSLLYLLKLTNKKDSKEALFTLSLFLI